MVDFSNCELLNESFLGGCKHHSNNLIKFKSEIYSLTFLPNTHKVGEYLSLCIFNMLGIKAQECLLGTYKTNNQISNVIAFKDFTYLKNSQSQAYVLYDFASIMNACINLDIQDSIREILDILRVIDEQLIIDPKILNEYFWNMFIVDAYIGNWDRHNGNWGFLKDLTTNELVVAPIYDCGSALYPQADNHIKELVLSNLDELKTRIYNRPLSAILNGGKKINYFDFYMETTRL